MRIYTLLILFTLAAVAATFVVPLKPISVIPTSTIIMGPADECIDTYLRSDISCADKEAVIKYRNALQDKEVRKLREETAEHEREEKGYYYVPLNDANALELWVNGRRRTPVEC